MLSIAALKYSSLVLYKGVKTDTFGIIPSTNSLAKPYPKLKLPQTLQLQMAIAR